MTRLALAASVAALAAPLAASQPAGAPFVGGVEYVYDDGSASVNIGPPSSFDPDMLWGNYFLTEPGGEVITEIAVAFGATFPSRPGGVTFWLLDDPDADFDPRTGATAVASVTAVPDVSGNTLFVVPIPPTPVSGAFFVGASARLLGGQDRPARVDTDARADRSWFFYAPDIAAVVDSLGAAPFGTRMDDATNVPFPGAFMVRAHGEPLPVAVADPAGAASPSLTVAGESPTRGPVALRLALAAPATVRVDVFDALGRRMATLAEGALGAGTHALTWTAVGAAPGIYVARLVAGAQVSSVRLVVAAR